MGTSTKTLPVELMNRNDGGTTVTLWYHGADAIPKLTVEVVDTDGEGNYFVLKPEDHECLDMYHHPYSYISEAA